MPAAGGARKPKVIQVTFKVDQDFFERLTAAATRASVSEGEDVSCHELARRMTEEGLARREASSPSPAEPAAAVVVSGVDEETLAALNAAVADIYSAVEANGAGLSDLVAGLARDLERQRKTLNQLTTALDGARADAARTRTDLATAVEVLLQLGRPDFPPLTDDLARRWVDEYLRDRG